MDVSVFFNPACSNCRTAEGILRERGVDAEYIRYLETAPTREQLEDVLAKLGTDDPREMLRTKEPEYERLALAGAGRDELLDAMVAHPVLIQRPIVIHGDRAVIARPPERLLALLGDSSEADTRGPSAGSRSPHEAGAGSGPPAGG